MSDDSAQPSVAIVKNFVAYHSVGVLSTVSRSCPGYPFGSIVPYDLAADGSIIIFISKISEHFRNLEADCKASLLIADRQGEDDPQPFARATVLADFNPVGQDTKEQVEQSYWRRFPNASSRALAHDFVFFSGSPARIRWIGGFGDIRWVSKEAYRAAALDPLSYIGKGITRHMNEDHRDALVTYLADQHQVQAAPETVEMIGIAADHLMLSVQSSSRREYRIDFLHRVQTAQEVRSLLIEMLQQIRAKA